MDRGRLDLRFHHSGSTPSEESALDLEKAYCNPTNLPSSSPPSLQAFTSSNQHSESNAAYFSWPTSSRLTDAAEDRENYFGNLQKGVLPETQGRLPTGQQATTLLELMTIRAFHSKILRRFSLGTAIGFRIRRGVLTDIPAILVFVARKVHRQWLNHIQCLPTALEGPGGVWCDVDVVEFSYFGEILSSSVREKIKAIHQTNYSEDSLPSHPLSFPCIYKVSKELRKLNKRAYNPWVVSIGPIHNNNDDDDDKEEQHLKEMEHIKVAYTEELFGRIAGKSASPEVKGYWMDKALMECSAAMLQLAASAFNCYADNLKPIIEKKIPQHRLAEMLLIDGCFILELLYRSCTVKNKITKGDPLLGNSMIMLGIRHDLLLLENQLPFFILNELFNKTIKTIPDHPWAPCPSLTQFVLSFFGDIMIFNNDDMQSTAINLEKDDCFHILHLLHSCHLPSSPSHASELFDFWHRASDLNRAGVKFVAGARKDQFDVSFEKDPGLLWWCDSAEFKIPPLSITDLTEPFLRNLIAFEQCCPYIERRHFTSYAFLMDSLIDSAADVELLEKAQIINNYLGASEDASVLFNNICKYAELEKFDFAIPRNDAEKHCRSFWPNILALLKRKYFSNPWSGFAVVAACILFVIAVVQTVYALLTYYGVEYVTVRELNDMHSVL